ncbi:hypothetical protein IB276_26030 [Ensifer sp. ENS04]|uniref:hypothetical protein n=1 Tax=Ensifer sp. ENS04 TaxID=2769281 RepID=UPI0017860DAD|nr:hypothetical protein [Ensifer sp. ENS04]MBD9542909.1 hypothetical protein [Ensifer sp. ENS04]
MTTNDSSNIDDLCDCSFFNFGDNVRSRQNPHLSGVVIGDRNWGSEYQVRLADGASTIWWHGIEIEHDPEFMPPDDEAKQTEGDNVIYGVDFTKGRKLRPNSDTEGAA